MTAYLLTAAGVIFLTVIVGFIIPDGKLNKSVNFILRIVSIGVLLQPVTGLFNFSPEADSQLADYEYICSVYSQTQSEQLEKCIKEDLGIDCVCIVDIRFDEGVIKENGVTVFLEEYNYKKVELIWEYLESAGYINISVNEKGS